jgi:23S rRNA (pseudouridine1915-N3)-methyltransferase
METEEAVKDILPSSFTPQKPMKNLIIRAIGKPTEPWQREAIHMFKDRLSAFGGVDVLELPEGHRGSAKPDPVKTQTAEAKSLLDGLPSSHILVTLDETGKSMTSEAFATQLTQWKSEAPCVVFLIGGSWGLADEVRRRARFVLSLGPMTLPHGLCRVVLLEQLYRAEMIASGRAYHK